MKLTKKTIVLIGFFLIAGFSIFYYMKTRVPFEELKPALGEAAPPISLADLAGNMVNLSDLRGKIVLINFWASWCPPCKDEMPGFQKVYDEFESKGFTVVAVAIDDISPGIIKELGITFPAVRSNSRVTASYGDVKDVPQSFLVGKDGRIIKKVKKTYSEDDLRKDVGKALGSGG